VQVKALEGYRIADFSHVMAGPFASHNMALMGAEVIKVEAPGRGDPFRSYGPDRRYDGMSAAFIAVNIGKQSIVLDLKQEAAKDVALRLIATSDVVLENFRPGVMERLGLGYDACKAVKPDIVFCSVSGYGQTGPMRDYPAIDNIVQFTSGMASLSGEPDGPAMRVGFPAVDTWTGMTAAYAVVTALLRRERTGEGAYIDVAMMDASIAFMTSAFSAYTVTGQTMARTGNTGFSAQPTAGLFQAGDGTWISLGVVQPNQYVALCKALGRPDLMDDARFATPHLRKTNEDALKTILAEVLATRPGAEWERVLSEAGAPCGLARDIPAVRDLPHLADRNLFLPIHVPGLPVEDVVIPNAGFVTNADGPGLSAPPPRHGEHTRQVLTMLGYDAAETDALIASGAAACPPGDEQA